MNHPRMHTKHYIIQISNICFSYDASNNYKYKILLALNQILSHKIPIMTSSFFCNVNII